MHRRGRRGKVPAGHRSFVTSETGGPGMSGYFGIGVEGVSKPANVGALLRTAHAFGAAFAFTVDAQTDAVGFRAADTLSGRGEESHPSTAGPPPRPWSCRAAARWSESS